MVPDSHGGYNLCVETGGRNVIVTSIHAGIEPPIINQYLSHRVTMDKVKKNMLKIWP
jgi:trehalose 6-phosphate synthase/phosphatase